MSDPQTFFEQIPVETVKQLFRERVRRIKKQAGSKEITMPQPAAGPDLASRDQSISQD
jgi:hypothetical protein